LKIKIPTQRTLKCNANKIQSQNANATDVKIWLKRELKANKREIGRIQMSFEMPTKQKLNGEPWSKFGVWE